MESNRKPVEEAMLESERQRRQAHPLEAMGTLAGGIAHDFNNILGAILGYGEMALRNSPQAADCAATANIGSISIGDYVVLEVADGGTGIARDHDQP